MSKNYAEIEYEEGSGNIFADLGLEEAEALHTKGVIGWHIIEILKKGEMKQKELSALLGIKQPEVSHLMNGHFSRFTTDKLLELLKRLNQKVTIHISPHQVGEPYRQVAFSASTTPYRERPFTSA